jgi:nicotinate-nucleotide adenylyltransferase
LGLTATLRRLGVFGGAFDPPHLAHVALARVAIEQLELDALSVIPTGHAWHKTRTLSPAEHRLNMARLAFSSDSKVFVDDRETRRVGPTYTIDTLNALKAEKPLVDLFLIIGADQARSLTTWHRWQEVAQSATICVAGRENSSLPDGEFAPLNALKGGFLRLNMPLNPVSATVIRARVAQHEPIAALVGEPVARYIAQHHLYLLT